MNPKRSALGRGLGALIPAAPTALSPKDYFQCPIGQIQADPDQPRKHFNEEALAELAQSIREQGIIQPIIVRRTDGSVPYTVIAGERRLRAATLAGLREVPIIVKEVAPEKVLELALIENIQRQDLDAIEEATAYTRLLEGGLTQEQLAQRVGKSRSTIANATRLLRLPQHIQELIANQQLSPGHARALLSIDDQTVQNSLLQKILQDDLTVRQAEAWAKDNRTPTAKPPSRARRPHDLQPFYDTITDELQQATDLPLEIKAKGRRGQIILPFSSLEELERLRDRLKSL